MKRYFIILSIFMSSITISMGQKVDSIKVEQSGDFIKIRYQILNSTPEQVYRVKVLCSMDGGLNTEIRSITGDVGDLVVGGKSEYWVVWDVLKDVDALKAAEFLVRAELVKDYSDVPGSREKKEIRPDRKNFLMVCLENDDPQKNLGFRFAYMSSFGVSAFFVAGPKLYNDDHNLGKYLCFSGGLDLTKRIIRVQGFEAHLFAGLALHELEPVDTQKVTKLYIGPDAGVILAINRVAITASISGVKNDVINSHGNFTVVGLGLRF